MANGIPPSLDRQAFGRNVVFVAAAAIIILLAAMAVIVSNRSGLGELSQEELDRGLKGERSEQSRESIEELHEAFAAAQRNILNHLNQQQVSDLQWVEKHHEGHRGWYKFSGVIELVDVSGQDHRLRYDVVVVKNEDESWRLEDIDVRP